MHKMCKESATTLASLINRLDEIGEKMDKETALLRQQIDSLEDNASKYTYAYEVFMTYFDKFPKNIQKRIESQLKEVKL